MYSVRIAVPVSIALCAGVAVCGPVKTTRTLVTDEEMAAWRSDAGMRNLMMNGDSSPFCAAVGHRPAAKWVEKDDEWLWKLMLPASILRTHTVGNDPFNPNKLGCPVHGAAIYSTNAFYPWVVDCENLPGKIKCPIGGETYPSNDFQAGDLTSGPYPDDGTGCVVDGKRYYFIGLYSHHAYNTGVVPAVRSLSRAYSLTGDPRYAHKTGVLLLKVATEYPNSTDRKNRTYIPGYGKGSGMITDVVWSSGALLTYAFAYDETIEMLRQDKELVAFASSRVPGLDSTDTVLQYIEDNLFRPGIQAIMDQNIRPNVGWGQHAMAAMALMLNDYTDRHPNTPDIMDWLYYSEDGKLKFLGNQFLKDGSSYESTGYNDMREPFFKVGEMVKRTKALAPVPYDEQRYPDILGNEKLQRFRDYKAAIRATGRCLIAVGDAGGVVNVPKTPPGRGGPVRPSEFLDGYGLAVLRDAPDECDATLFYGGLRGHAHYDPLFIGFHAIGYDLLPNIGYPQSWSFAAAWEWSLITHMTVAVDRNETPCSTVVGSLRVFDTGSTVQVMEASKRPYRKSEPRGENGPDVTDYRRMVVLLKIPGAAPDECYGVDIFRVVGGSDHLQSWHGPYTVKPVAVEGVVLTPQGQGTLAGPDVAYGQHYKDARGADHCDPYCHLKNVARGPMGAVTAATWAPETAAPIHLRLNFVPMAEVELIRADGGAPIAPDKDVLQWAFQHAAGEPGLRSQFVTLLEPYRESRLIRGIRRLEVTGADPSGYAPVALEVAFADGRDLLLATGDVQGEVKGEGFRLLGRFGVIRERNGQVIEMHLTEGTLLEYGERRVTLPAAPPRGKIVAVTRGQREITIEGALGDPAALAGRRLMIDNHGERVSSYTICKAEPAGEGRTRLTLDSNGVLSEGLAVGYEDGVILNGPKVNLPFAGLVKMQDGRLDYSDCFHSGGHMENGTPGVSLKVRGVIGFPYQAWANLHIAGTNHVHLAEKVPADTLKKQFEAQPEFAIYEYGVGDDVSVGQSAHVTDAVAATSGGAR
ncbi:MAG: hypothetical protein A3K19_11545 [Lentisphaerae bacterium RIFOXYB12_FULL_65_16]|nr:MAG: hypothetical protein A3K18_27525 [Lentisphaerae bacterium RIFOXYA12_64_32]OGV88251.1 MAG: hypothetical protein A3K19_11545 [Lentisphaerae bacterium RIFOXYB12_FULL_65_16]